MRNIFGTEDNLELFNRDGKNVYEFYRDARGYLWEYTSDSNGNPLTFKCSDGQSYKYTRDSNGNELTYKNSDGVKRGFDIPEYTMEELCEKLGEFKLVKK